MTNTPWWSPLDLHDIAARAVVASPSRLRAAMACIPDGEIRYRNGIVSDGATIREAVRAAAQLAFRDVPALVSRVEQLEDALLAERETFRRDSRATTERETYRFEENKKLHAELQRERKARVTWMQRAESARAERDALAAEVENARHTLVTARDKALEAGRLTALRVGELTIPTTKES